jgi:hypothetical protein
MIQGLSLAACMFCDSAMQGGLPLGAVDPVQHMGAQGVAGLEARVAGHLAAMGVAG